MIFLFLNLFSFNLDVQFDEEFLSFSSEYDNQFVTASI